MKILKTDLDSLRIKGKKVEASLAQAITSLRVDIKPGEVPQVSIVALDPHGLLAKAGLNVDGTEVMWQGLPWVAVGVGLDIPAEGSSMQRYTLRSPTSVHLRREYRSSVQRKVDLTEWARPRVEAAGRKFVGQPAATKSTIAQASGDDQESELDVLSQGASGLDWSFMDRGDAFWLMSKEWAFTHSPEGQKTWPISHQRGKVSDLRAASFDSSPVDDTESFATANITLPYEYATRLLPWDLALITDQDDYWNGLWLIDGQTYTADLVSPIAVPLVRPKPPKKKSGSKKKSKDDE